MDYRIEKEDLTIYGYKLDVADSEAFLEIPAFFNKTLKELQNTPLGDIGSLAVTINDEKDFNLTHYYVAGRQAQDNLESYHFANQLWVKFPCHGAYPYGLQRLAYDVYNTRFSKHQNYTLACDASIDYLPEGDKNSPDYYCELWLPITKTT
jgi:AraC family transcriptional regulator